MWYIKKWKPILSVARKTLQTNASVKKTANASVKKLSKIG